MFDNLPQSAYLIGLLASVLGLSDWSLHVWGFPVHDALLPISSFSLQTCLVMPHFDS